MATGFPERVPAWYTGPSGARWSMISAEPPRAAAGMPPPITLPKHQMSGVQPSGCPDRPQPPVAVARKPVSTSSQISSAPWRRVISRRNALKPSAGSTTPMLQGTASVMSAAMRSPCSANTASTAARSL